MDSAWIHKDIGVVLMNQGKLDEAAAEFREAVRLEPKRAWFHHFLGNALILLGEHSEGIAEDRIALQLEPTSPIPLNNLAWDLAISPATSPGELEEAWNQARKAIELSDQVIGQFYNTLGVIELRRGNWQTAMNALQVGMKDRGRVDANDWFPLAIVHWHLDKKTEANTWFDKAVTWTKTFRPNDPELRLLWTWAAEVLGRPGPEGLPAHTRAMPNGADAFAH